MEADLDAARIRDDEEAVDRVALKLVVVPSTPGPSKPRIDLPALPSLLPMLSHVDERR
jgi:hypothetical protein